MLYIILFIVIILIFAFLYLYRAVVEKFDSQTTATNSPSTEIKTTIDELNTILTSVSDTNAPEYKYTEKLSDIPHSNNLVLYASTFSDKTNYNKEMNVYMPESQRWNNFVNDNQSLFIITSKTLPASIKSPLGLPLKDIRLDGVQSAELNNNNYVLGSFTITLFLQFTNIDFSTNPIIELFNISLESPNYVKLTLEKHTDPTKEEQEVLLYSHVGDMSSACKSGSVINKTLFLSSTTPTSISMVYTKVSDTKGIRNIYINNVIAHTSEEYTFGSSLILGNSKIILNRFANLDATLHSFMYFSTNLSITQHNEIIAYCDRQKSYVPSIISQIKDLTLDKITIIRNLIIDQTLTQENLKDKLDKCILESKKEPTVPEEEPEFKYKISPFGNEPTSADMFKIKPRATVPDVIPEKITLPPAF